MVSSLRLALSLAFLFLPITVVRSQQQHQLAPPLSLNEHEHVDVDLLPLSSLDSSPSPLFTSTLVDLLSSDPSYSTLIHLLQRTKLIPTLNKLNGSTLFAPTNDAFKRANEIQGSFWQGSFDDDSDLWDDKNPNKKKKPDNILFELRQNLLYHLLNFTLPLSPSDDNDTSLSPKSLFPSTDQQPTTLETLLFPSPYTVHKTPIPAPAPPWLPERGGLLGFEGQRLRGIHRGERDGEDWVGVDWKGEGGVKILEVKESANGIVVKVEDVLEKPGSVGESRSRSFFFRLFFLPSGLFFATSFSTHTDSYLRCSYLLCSRYPPHPPFPLLPLRPPLPSSLSPTQTLPTSPPHRSQPHPTLLTLIPSPLSTQSNPLRSIQHRLLPLTENRKILPRERVREGGCRVDRQDARCGGG